MTQRDQLTVVTLTRREATGGRPRRCRAAAVSVDDDELTPLFISLVDEISSNDAQPEMDGGSDRRVLWAIEDVA